MITDSTATVYVVCTLMSTDYLQLCSDLSERALRQIREVRHKARFTGSNVTLLCR